MNIFVVRNPGEKPYVLVSHMTDQKFRDYLAASGGDEEIGSMITVQNQVAEGLLNFCGVDRFGDELEELLTAVYNIDRDN